MEKFLTFGVPLVLVTVYRLQPDSIRGFYQRHGWPTSTSHQAVAGIWDGQGWAAVFRAVGDSKVPRPELP
jgi:hypothetical protein